MNCDQNHLDEQARDTHNGLVFFVTIPLLLSILLSETTVMFCFGKLPCHSVCLFKVSNIINKLCNLSLVFSF